MSMWLPYAILYPLLVGAADVSRYRVPMGEGGFIGTSSSQALAPGQVAATATIGFAKNPITWRYEDDTYDPVVGDRLLLDTMLSVGVVRLIDAAVGLPLGLYQGGETSRELGEMGGAGLGDLRLLTRVTFLPERIFGVGAGLITEVTVPVGDERRFLGDPSTAVRPRVVVTGSAWRLTLYGSLGYHLRKDAVIKDLELGDEITFSVGAAHPIDLLGAPCDALYELQGATAAAQPLTAGGRTALEARSALRIGITDRVQLLLGGGVGVTQGVGSPMFRVFVAATYATAVSDQDGDGVADHVDACPEDPEDYDRFADLDGCPEDGGAMSVDDVDANADGP